MIKGTSVDPQKVYLLNGDVEWISVFDILLTELP